jgi:hypothetical protein
MTYLRSPFIDYMSFIHTARWWQGHVVKEIQMGLVLVSNCWALPHTSTTDKSLMYGFSHYVKLCYAVLYLISYTWWSQSFLRHSLIELSLDVCCVQNCSWLEILNQRNCFSPNCLKMLATWLGCIKKLINIIFGKSIVNAFDCHVRRVSETRATEKAPI